jgi:Tol biopolymer transport system component
MSDLRFGAAMIPRRALLWLLLAAGCGRTGLEAAARSDGSAPVVLAVTGDLPASAKVGEAYLGSLGAVDASGPCEWSVQGAMPPGLALGPDGAIALVTGTPALSGAYQIEVRVRDAAGHEASRSFRIQVRPRSWLAAKVSQRGGGSETDVVDSDTMSAMPLASVVPGKAGASRVWAWSPAGDLFAFVVGTVGKGQVMLADLRGMSAPPGFLVGTPDHISRIDFTSDNRWLLYQTDTTVYAARVEAGVPSQPTELLSVPAGLMGSELSKSGWLMVRGQIRSPAIELFAIDLGTEPPGMAAPIHPALVAGGNVSAWGFSPDGRWAMYEADAEADDRYEIYAVDLASRKPVKLNALLPPRTVVGSAVPGEELDFGWPAWSPDSSKLAFTAAEPGGESALYVAWVAPAPRTGKLSQAFPADRKLGDFWWADSTRLLYVSVSREGGPDHLMMVDTSLGPPRAETLMALVEGTIAGVVVDPLDRGVLFATGRSMDWVSWYWQDFATDARRKVYGPVGWSWGLYQPSFSVDGALLFTTEGDDWPNRTGAALYRAAPDPGVEAEILAGQGLSCDPYGASCRRFWRNDGRKLAFLTADGSLHLMDAGNGPPSAQVLMVSQGDAITDFAWPP